MFGLRIESTYLTNHHHLTVSLRGNVTSVCVLCDKELLAVGHENGQTSILEIPDLKERCTLGTVRDDSQPKQSDKRNTFVPPIYYNHYGIREASRGTIPLQFGFVRGNISCCSFSPNGKRLVTSDRSTGVKL